MRMLLATTYLSKLDPEDTINLSNKATLTTIHQLCQPKVSSSKTSAKSVYSALIPSTYVEIKATVPVILIIHIHMPVICRCANKWDPGILDPEEQELYNCTV